MDEDLHVPVVAQDLTNHPVSRRRIRLRTGVHEKVCVRRRQSGGGGHERRGPVQGVLVVGDVQRQRGDGDGQRDGASRLGQDGRACNDQVRRPGHPHQQRRHELQEQADARRHRGRIRQGHGRQRQEHLPQRRRRRPRAQEQRWREYRQHCQYRRHEAASRPGLVQCFQSCRCECKSLAIPIILNDNPPPTR